MHGALVEPRGGPQPGDQLGGEASGWEPGASICTPAGSNLLSLLQENQRGWLSPYHR